MYKKHFILCFLVTVAWQTASFADYMFVFDNLDYQVQPGEQFDIHIFLAQTRAGAGLDTDGLIAGGVRVFFDDPSAAEPASVNSLGDIFPAPAFDDTLLGPDLDLVPSVSAGFVDSVDDPFAPIIGQSILLGTFTFTAGTVLGDVTNLRATDFDPLTEDLIAGDLDATVLDGSVADGFATVTTVPEPNSLLLMPLTLVILRSVRRSRQ